MRVLLSGVERKNFQNTSLDALPLSYRRRVGAKAIKSSHESPVAQLLLLLNTG